MADSNENASLYYSLFIFNYSLIVPPISKLQHESPVADEERVGIIIIGIYKKEI
jgi:hypothetical protein